MGDKAVMILILSVNFIAWIVYLFFGITRSIKAQIAGDDWAVIDNNFSIIFTNLILTLLAIATTVSILMTGSLLGLIYVFNPTW